MQMDTTAKVESEEALKMSATSDSSGLTTTADATTSAKNTGKKNRFGWIMALYLLGLFLGSLTMGVITPVRTIIQSCLGVDSATGIWMINIFTLMYAAVIPISGKLADRHGRKIVFLFSIALFGVGSLLCGLANSMDSFTVLLIGRIVQGLGAGGIMPIATAEFGTSFPPEKRGMALGLVGGVYGIGSVLGATLGSLIIDIFGVMQWQWVFYMNIPFCLFIIALGLIYIPNHKAEQVFKVDKLGTLLMVVIIISLLYGLKNVDFFNFFDSITQWQAWAFILLAVVLIPIFVIVEKRAEDPIFHIEYMGNKQIVITLLVSLLVGMVMMGMVFIPQFAENALHISSGDGGYFVIVLGLFAGVVSPISGTMVDRFGEKGVMTIGLVISAAGGFYLAFIAAAFPNIPNVIISLILIGLGMGFTMGTPLNYMMMANTKEEESNSALATLSLVRSIGTAIAPALMVGFIIQAAGGLQTELMGALPPVSNTPKMEQQAELEKTLDELVATDDQLQALLASMDTSSMSDMGMDLSSQKSVREQLDEMDIDAMLQMGQNFDMSMDMNTDSGQTTMPDYLLDKMQNSDVTTIVGVVQELVDWVFTDAMDGTISDIQNGIQEGIDGVGQGIDGIGSGIAGIGSGIAQMDSAMGKMTDQSAVLQSQINQMEQAVTGMQTSVTARENQCQQMENAIMGIQMQNAQLQTANAQKQARIDVISNPSDPESIQLQSEIAQNNLTIGQNNGQIAGMQEGIKQMREGKNGINETKATIQQMQQGMQEMGSGVAGMDKAVQQMTNARGQMLQAQSLMSQEQSYMQHVQSLMISMKNDIPALFDSAKDDYKILVDEESGSIEGVYQNAINQGYRNMYILVGVLSLFALMLLMFYKQKPHNPSTAGKGHKGGMNHAHKNRQGHRHG